VSGDGGPSRGLTNPSSRGYIPAWSADGASIYHKIGPQIWRTAVAGGPSVQVTRKGALEGRETYDGKYFYFTKGIPDPGIWRLPVGGGDEELLPELASVRAFRSWDITKDGIYYVDSGPKTVLKFFRFRDRKTSTVAEMTRPPQQSERGLSVSRDGNLILYLQMDSIRNEILVAPMPQ
jgi:hypothetical protein